MRNDPDVVRHVDPERFGDQRDRGPDTDGSAYPEEHENPAEGNTEACGRTPTSNERPRYACRKKQNAEHAITANNVGMRQSILPCDQPSN